MTQSDGQQPKHPLPSELVLEDASFADLVEEFLGEMPGRLAQIDGAMKASDFDGVRRCAHQLKGSGGGYGYPALTELAARIEQDALAQQLEACRRGINELQELTARMVVGNG